ncbi:polysaccharide transporter, PST family/lipopolysaccharide exporter [Chitinophaga sp. YR573]|uniref:MOP flippase family protein n=1 Tax=Chitinophaga sp. YR573 TaxID=1881040 RepID=UPI0008D7F957|nr:MOP flippase family protein [Chitinophaga sp. YR573]SEW14557.1 polysaccharide transporter, PST family/lipopolysaccharide exporter [Chitinophaga sp. YR573]
MLKEKAILGIKWTTLSSAIGALVQLLQVVILSRFLSPADFGVMAIAIFFIGFSQLFLDMGIPTAIIYNQQVSKQQLDSLFWLNIIVGWSLFVVILLMAPSIAAFYHEAQLKNIIILIASAFIILPFEQQFYALMKKELLFNQIAKRDITAKLISFVVAIVLAWKGAGVYALVISYLVSVFLGAILVIISGIKFHKPGMHFRFSDTKPFLSFGLYQSGENMLNYFYNQVDTLLIGKLLGVEMLGIYNVAKNLSMRPTQVINPIVTQVTFPVMAKLQHDDNMLKSIYLKSVNYLSSVNFPIYTYMGVFAAPLIALVFGNRWHDAGPLLQILSAYAMVRSIINPIGTLLFSKGKMRLSFFWNCFMFLCVPVAVIIGSMYGLLGIAYAHLILITVLLFISWRVLAYPLSKATFSEFFGLLLKPFKVACCLLLAFLLINHIPGLSPLTQTISGAFVLILLIIPANKYFNRAFYLEAVNLLHPLRRFLPKLYP